MSSPGDTKALESGGSNRRHKYVINPTFQWKYALLTALAVFLITSILSSILYGLLHHQARERLIHPETYTAEVTLVILLFGVAFAGVSAVGVGIWSVVVTHRFCGPIFVIDRYLKTLARGRVPKLRNLRRKDEFKAFYETFRAAVDAIREHRVAHLQALREAHAAAKACLEADDAERRQILEAVIAHLDRLEHNAEQAAIEEAATPCAAPEEVPDSAAAAPVALT